MRTWGADSLDTRQTGPIPVTSRSNGDGRRVKLVDANVRQVARERLAWAAPPAAAASLLVLAVADLMNVAAPIQLVLVAVATVALLAIRSEEGALRTELRQARVTAVDAVDLERSRVQHDLHDSVQQRLIGIRIRLEDLSQRAAPDDVREGLDRLGAELEAALGDIRNITLGSAPEYLELRGLREALRDAVSRTPLRITLDFRARRRYPPDVERCVYFCCLEAIQNILKHAGSKARAWVRVTERAGRLTFEVEDSGVGFDLAPTYPGRGMASLADRVGALGGRLHIDTRPGFGTLVRGEVPLS
jgi:signal transduction histidine kinase